MIASLTPFFKDWAPTIGLLAVVTSILLLVMMITLRQFSLWFLKINQIMATQERILDSMRQLQSEIAASKAASSKIIEADILASPLTEPQTKVEQFKLNN